MEICISSSIFNIYCVVSMVCIHLLILVIAYTQVMHMIALLVKRASLESDRETVFESMFSAITQLLTSDFTKMVRQGTSQHLHM